MKETTLPETWKKFKARMESLGVTEDTMFNRIAIHPWSIEGKTVLTVELFITIGRILVKTPDPFPDIIEDPLVAPGEFSLVGLDLDPRPIPPFEMDKFPHLAEGIGWEKVDGTWWPRPWGEKQDNDTL